MLDRRFAAMIFDFDGVIVESTELKTEAFRALFADRAGRIEAIVDLHRRHAGVDRFTKFEMIYRDILHEPLTASIRQDLGVRFAQLVEDAVTNCPMVPGAGELLATLDRRMSMAVVSSTPQRELERVVARRGLGRFFAAVRGSPPAKSEAVRALLEERGWTAANVLMVGDAAADLAAARTNGVAFIGRLTPGDPYPFSPEVPTVRDLTPLAESARRLYATTQPQAATS
ncbi:MAG TPA: HAD family hydrolase [Stellaceae bacterium]|nr:HAD family hydrolase [Stellaceae bacterium]